MTSQSGSVNELVKHITKLIELCEDLSSNNKELRSIDNKYYKKELNILSKAKGLKKLKQKKKVVRSFLELYHKNRKDILKDKFEWLVDKRVLLKEKDCYLNIEIGRICYSLNLKEDEDEGAFIYMAVLLLNIFKECVSDKDNVKKLQKLCESYIEE